MTDDCIRANLTAASGQKRSAGSDVANRPVNGAADPLLPFALDQSGPPRAPRHEQRSYLIAFLAHAAAMGITKSFQHENYELLCSAKALDSGKFVPTLVISKQRWPSRPRTISVQCDGCLTEEDAISSAYAQGVDWVLNYG